MPNTTGGKKFKRGKTRRVSSVQSKPIKYKMEPGVDHYGLVSKMLGCNRVAILLDDGTMGQAIIPGRFKKKRIFIRQGTMVHVDNGGEIVRLIAQNDSDYKEAYISLKPYADDREISFDGANSDGDDDDENIDKEELEKMQEKKFDMKTILPPKNKENVRTKEKEFSEKFEDI
jgi:translation initiation factor IF-1